MSSYPTFNDVTANLSVERMLSLNLFDQLMDLPIKSGANYRRHAADNI